MTAGLDRGLMNAVETIIGFWSEQLDSVIQDGEPPEAALWAYLDRDMQLCRALVSHLK